jgi:hypothetical protein
MALQQLALRGRGQVAVVFYEMLVVFFNGEADIDIPLICASHSPKLRQTVEESVLQNYTGAGGPCQP